MTQGLLTARAIAVLATVSLLAGPAARADTYYSLEMDPATIAPGGLREDGRTHSIKREGGGTAARLHKDWQAGSTVLTLRSTATPRGASKDRAEVQIYSGITFGRTWFLGLRAKARGDVPKDGWHLFLQCHQAGSQKPPPLSLNLEAGHQMALIARGSTDSYEKIWSGPMPQGRWTDIVLGFRMGDRGHVRMWVNGQKVSDTRLPLRWDGYEDRCVLKTGLYRSASATPFQMSFDDIRLGDSYRDVAR